MKIKFACLNLWFGGILFEDILKFLAETDADVIALQEVLDSADPKLPKQYHSLKTLQDTLHYPFQDFAPAIIDKFPWGEALNGNAILSRFPIKHREVIFFNEPFNKDDPRDPFDPKNFPTTPRNLQHVTLHTDAGEINVINLQGVWDLNGDNFSKQRQNMSNIIIKTAKGKQNVIVAGDTNAKHTNPAMRAIEEHLTSVFGNELTTTFNMRRKDNPGYATAAVDLLYVSKDITVLEHNCPDVDVSDHLPLTATFEINHKI